MEIKAQEKEQLRTLAKESLFFLSKGILGNEQLSKSFHGDLCGFLQGPSKRKLTCIPRGFFKTTNATIARAIQSSLQDPFVSQLICMQRMGNAATVIDDIRRHWERNVVLQSLFPELVPAFKSKWNSEEARLNRPEVGGFNQPQSTYEAAGIGTQLQSRHYDKIYADDLVVAQKDQTTGTWMQPSEEEIQKAIGWHQMTWGIARNVQELEYLQTMTRWCPNDLYDYFLKEEPGIWDVFLRPAILPTGEASFPEKYPLEALDVIRISQGSYKFSTQYMCKPVDTGLLLFHDKYHLYLRGEEPKEFKKIVASFDPAIGQKKQSHPSAFVCVGQTKEGKRYLLDAQAKKLTPSEQIDLIFNAWKRLRFKELAIETVAYQESLVYSIDERFQKEGGRLFRVTPVNPGRGEKKEARIEGLHPSFETGWWYVRSDQAALREQLDQYPMGTYDDLLDALAQSLRILPKHQGVNVDQEKTQTYDHTMITYEEIMKSLEKKRKKPGKLWSRQRQPLRI